MGIEVFPNNIASRAAYYQGTAPTSPVAGDVWVDSSSTNDAYDLANYYYKGTDATGFRNVLINGDFSINQRGASSYASSSGNVYTVDRWFMRQYFPDTTGATLTVTTGAPVGFKNCVRLQRNSGQTWTQVNVLEQVLETASSIPLQEKQITISAWMRKGADFSAANNYAYLGYRYGKGTDQSPTNSNFTNGGGEQTAFTLTTTWQRFSTTFTLPTDETQLSFYAAFVPVGTAGTNDYIEIAGFQVERGPYATPFEYRPIQQELALCQRYYAQVGGGSMGKWTSATQLECACTFPVPMRKVPDDTPVSNAASVLRIGTGGYTTSTFSRAASYGTNTGMLFVYTTSNHGASAGEWGALYSNSIALSAEL